MQITLLHLFFPSVNFASRPTVDDTSVFSNNCNKTILYCSFIVASLQLHCSCCSEDSFIMPPPVGKGHKALPLSVRPSVRPSVAYIANNSRTQRPSAPKFGMKVPHLYQTSIPLSRSKGQRSKVKVTRLINADTHPAAYQPVPTYCIPLDVVVRRISRLFLY